MHELLDVKNLKVVFDTYSGKVSAVSDLSFVIHEREVVGIVGESGSGKSASMLSILKLLPENGKLESGGIFFEGHDLNDYAGKKLQDIRGNKIGIIFQDPMTSLDPVFTIGNQLVESILRHKCVTKTEARKRAVELLKEVGIPDPEKRIGQYPHELSGGMRQRVMIATALSCEPRLLIADEPTSALDVTIQAQIIELLKGLKERRGMSVILVTHDFGLVAEICDRVIVMYGGLKVEEGKIDDIFYKTAHPYTKGLLKSIPGSSKGNERMNSIIGQPPDMSRPLVGCPFVSRCPDAMEICNLMKPMCSQLDAGHEVACWLHYKERIGVEA